MANPKEDMTFLGWTNIHEFRLTVQLIFLFYWKQVVPWEMTMRHQVWRETWRFVSRSCDVSSQSYFIINGINYMKHCNILWWFYGSKITVCPDLNFNYWKFTVFRIVLLNTLTCWAEIRQRLKWTIVIVCCPPVYLSVRPSLSP